MKYSNYIYIALLGLSLLSSACATQGVSALIRENEGLKRELSVRGTADSDYRRGQNIKVSGAYYGIAEINNTKYYVIKLNDIRGNYGRNHNAILYLPSAADINPVIKENRDFEDINFQNVEVTFLDGLVSDVPSWSDKKYEEPFNWNGYPDKVLIYYWISEPDLKAHYRFGAEAHDINLLYIKNELEWECRSRSSYYAAHALYPFAAVYDAVTFPLQYLLWQIWH
jgi:hypothetical protein